MNATVFCNQCGAANSAGAHFCARCGTTMIPGAAPTSPSQPSAATAAPAGYAASVAGYANPGYAAPVPGYPAAGYPAQAYPVAGVRYGGFWIRVIAAIIDWALLRIVIAPFGMIFGLGGLAVGGYGHGFNPIHLLGGGVVFMLALFGGWIYEALMESSSYQATLGKMIFGMKVTDLYGNRISFARATGRHFAKIVSGLMLCIGFIMVGLTERKQGLHDMIAGTLVPRS